MGLFDMLRNELIDIVEWTDMAPGVLVHRFDRHDNELKYGAKLIVRPGQRAIFVSQGCIADVFESGEYSLKTSNLPLLTTLMSWSYGFNSPFKAEIYFINTTEQLDRKWGTPTPVMMRDNDFGVVRLRARGNYSYTIGLTSEMISRFVGAREEFTVVDIEGQVKTKIVSSFSDCVGETKIPALDLASQYDEIGEEMLNRLTSSMAELGLNIIAFNVENITVPEEVEKAMDQRSSIGVLDNLNNFSQFQAANAVRDMANNDGGSSEVMGMMMGAQMAGGIGGVMKEPEGASQSSADPTDCICAKCQSSNSSSSKFCSSCGSSLLSEIKNCIKCNSQISGSSKFCGECGSPQVLNCAGCGIELSPSMKFCGECGHKV